MDTLGELVSRVSTTEEDICCLVSAHCRIRRKPVHGKTGHCQVKLCTFLTYICPQPGLSYQMIQWARSNTVSKIRKAILCLNDLEFITSARVGAYYRSLSTGCGDSRRRSTKKPQEALDAISAPWSKAIKCRGGIRGQNSE
jgi:hypothetical protein